MIDASLAAHLEERPARLAEAVKKGVKVIGYFPGGFVPEELIYAAGAIPVCLVESGSSAALGASLGVMPQSICPFARAQVGERMLRKNPYYNLLDMLVAPTTCQHLKKAAEIWEYWGDLEIFKLGVPHHYDGGPELDYYTHRLAALKERLEALTGNVITAEKIGEAVELYNRIRASLRQLSLLRRRSPSPLEFLDFVKLNHASFYADPVFMAEALDSACREVAEKVIAAQSDRPRLLLVAPNLAAGDYNILELIGAAGADIVAEVVCEGIRYYRHEIDNKGDILASLARSYLRERLPCAYMRYSAPKRLEFALKLLHDFDAVGVIWYELLYCETYDSESYYFARELKKRGIPMHTLELDYGMAGTGQIKTRIEAFVELVKGGPN